MSKRSGWAYDAAAPPHYLGKAQKFQMKYDPALDGMRAIAVLSVVVFHVTHSWLPGGWAGVDVFFALSGYLITSILLAELAETGKIDLKRFYFRRALRLVPAFVLVLAFVGLIALLQNKIAIGFEAIAYSGSYLMNWNRAFDWGPQYLLGHTWSLAIEEQFYLVWPLFLIFAPTRLRLPLTIMLIICVVSWRIHLTWLGAGYNRTYNGFDTHADALLIGCVLAFVWKPKSTFRTPPWLSALTVGGMLTFLITVWYQSDFAQTVGYSAVALLSIALTICAKGEGWLRSTLSVSWLVFIGRISYGIYLWHYPLLHVIRPAVPGPSWILAIILTFAIAVVSFRVVEVRFLRLKDRWKSLPRDRSETFDTAITRH